MGGERAETLAGPLGAHVGGIRPGGLSVSLLRRANVHHLALRLGGGVVHFEQRGAADAGVAGLASVFQLFWI